MSTSEPPPPTRLRTWWERAVAWAVLVVPAAALAAVVLFLGVAEEVGDGDTSAIDRTILLAMRMPGDPDDPVGPPWFEEAVRDVTALGGYAVLVLLVAAVLGLLLLWRRGRDALIVLVAVLGSLGLNHALKAHFARARPDLVRHAAVVESPSFPSGHSMVAATVYLTLAAMLARALPDRRLKIYVVACAVLVTLLVGVSRVYLGVHWPSDVVGGWIAGAAWGAATWSAAEAWSRLRGRRDV